MTLPFARPLAVLLCAALVSCTGCMGYKLTPEKPDSMPQSSAGPLPLKVGLAVESSVTDPMSRNLLQRAKQDFGASFAQALRGARLFQEVRYPASGRAREAQDLLLTARFDYKFTNDPAQVAKILLVTLTGYFTGALMKETSHHEAKGELTVTDRAGQEVRAYSESADVEAKSMVSMFAEMKTMKLGPVAAVENLVAKLVQSLIDDRALLERAKDAAPPPPAYAQTPYAAPAAPRATSDVDAPRYASAPRPDDFAVVVGIEGYSRLPAASHAERDADAVKRHLLALGLPERNIIMLQGQRAVRSQLAAYLEEWLPRNVRPDSTVFFYYSGHGAPDPKTGQAFLIPWDGDPVFLQSTAYPVKKLHAQLSALKARRTIVALDACFSGAGGRSVLAPGTKPLVTKVEELRPEGEVTLFTASAGDEITGSLDEQGHGMFTYYFLKALDAGKRRSRDIFDYLKPRVQDEARRQNREQSPGFFGPDEYLGPNASAVPAEPAQLDPSPTPSGEGERQPSRGDAPKRIEKPSKGWDDQL